MSITDCYRLAAASGRDLHRNVHRPALRRHEVLHLRFRGLSGLGGCHGGQREQHEPRLDGEPRGGTTRMLLPHGVHEPGGRRQVTDTLMVTGAASLFLNRQFHVT